MEKKHTRIKAFAQHFIFTLALVCSGKSSAQIQWLTPSGQAWLLPGNWTGGIVPGGTDIAQFATVPGGAGVGINMNQPTNNGLNNQAVAAIAISAARSTALLIGNSSTSKNGTLTLNGANINGTNNVVLNNSSAGLLTIQNEQALGNKVMEIALANVTENVIVIDGVGGISISSVISGIGKNITLLGTGSGLLSFTAANTYTGLTNVASGTLQLNKTGGGTLSSLSNIAIGAAGTLRVSSNQTINNFTMNSGGGVLVIDPGVTLTIAGNYNVSSGTINNQGTIKLNGGAISFPGTGVTINNGTANTMTNLEIATSADVTQTTAFSISGKLTLTTGIINSPNNDFITLKDNAVVEGVSNASFVDGKVGKAGDDAFVFPVGKAIVGYVPVGISAQPNIGNVYIAEYKRPVITSYPIGPTVAGLDHVSSVDHWILDGSGVPATIDVTLYWTAQSSNNGAATYINTLSSLVIAHSDGTYWDSYSIAGQAAGNVIAGSVMWQGVTALGPFTLGSVDFGNPLPVGINYLKGFKQNNKHYLQWQLACANSSTATISIERSADRQNFAGIATITTNTLNCQQPFEYADNNPLTGMNYYRLKITDVNNKVTYSASIAILNKESGFDITGLMPTVVSNNATLNVAAVQKTKMNVVITDITGRQVQKLTYNLIAGSNQLALDMAKLSAGTYQIVGYTEEGISRTIRFVKQ